jgi:hypothetical protein
MMALRLLLVLTVLLMSCSTNDPNKKGTIDEIDRRHSRDMQRMGGGGGSDGST